MVAKDSPSGKVTQTVPDSGNTETGLTAAEALAQIDKLTTSSISGTAEKDEAGYSFCRDKRKLIGKPFVIVEWTEPLGNFGGPYAHVRIVTRDRRTLCFDDSSTGVYAQLIKLRENGQTSGIACPNGLRVSEYTHEETGRAAATFYLDEN